MVVSFDMGADYGVASEVHVTVVDVDLVVDLGEISNPSSFICVFLWVVGNRRDRMRGEQKDGAEQKGFKRDQSGSGGGRETLPLCC